MKRNRLILTALVAISCLVARADEGMWMLQLMKEQHLIDQMKKQGLTLEAQDIYSPDHVSLKDAVGIFGRGCTGEVISADGLVLTNHHCGFDAIQRHSSVENDLLKNGFWSMSQAEELPSEGLTFTFIERIEDVTDHVARYMKEHNLTDETMNVSEMLIGVSKELENESDLKGKPGISFSVLPFYAGNKYYLFVQKVYPDVRLVAAPPQCIGKFGGETDNWMWPRHTCDFSIFRIYADAHGEPAAYSPDNVPLKSKKHLTISLRGIENEDFAMIIGFPGSTERFLTASEVASRALSINIPRIKVRTARQEVLKEEMAASDKVRIQYASKYASSSNYWKNAIGMNKAIVDNKVIETKQEQEKRFAEFAKRQGNREYIEVVDKIDRVIAGLDSVRSTYTAFMETFRAIEFATPFMLMDQMKQAIQSKDKKSIQEISNQLREMYAYVHNKDYDHEVDRKVAIELLYCYADLTDELPAFYEEIYKKYKGYTDAYVNDMYGKSIFASEENLEAFLKKPTVKAIDKDLSTNFCRSVYQMRDYLTTAMNERLRLLIPLHKTYVRGLCEMYAPTPKAADANFTMRMTYGNVRPYSPKDGVFYQYYTTLKGVMEKEDPDNPEFNVPEKLKELYEKKDFGRYAMKSGELPTCFLTNNDITGGNSGSPVLNGQGQLIGCAFDGNWESLSGDINFDTNLQRCICVDIRYILFMIEKFGECPRLVNEMTIAE